MNGSGLQSRPILWLLAGLAGSGAGCLDGGLPRHDLPDSPEALDVAPDDSGFPDVTPDTTEPDEATSGDLPSDLGHVGAFCGVGEACNEPLDGEGRCPGQCVGVAAPLRCDGVVRLGICLRHVPADSWDPPEETGTALRLALRDAPPWVVVGDVFPVLLEVRNPGPTPVRAAMAWKHPDTVEAVEDPLLGGDAWRLEPGETRSLRFVLRAVRANVFQPESQEYLTLQAGDDVIRIPGGIVFGQQADRTCGDWRFPSTWSLCEDCSTYDRYWMAACCDGVFFPGASCCRDEDCSDAVCVDGHCVPWAPWSGLANTLPRGNQRVLVVAADDPEALPGLDDPCGSPWPDGESRLQVKVVEDWFNDRAEDRIRRRPLRLGWWFAAVPDSQVFAPSPEDQVWSRWLELLDQWRADRGCPPLSDFDKVVAYSPRLDLQGFGGQAGDRGRIGAMTLFSPYLLAHELAHTFGASDLYLDLGGTTWLRGGLMANGWGIQDPPEDRVTWGEIGLSDLDRDGVVDLASYLDSPDALEIALARAVLTPKGSLELALAIGGRQGDRSGRVQVPLLMLELPEHQVTREVREAQWIKPVAFDGNEVDLEAVRQRQRVTVRVRVDLPVTTEDFRREVRTLDATRVLRVTEQQPPAPAMAARSGPPQGSN